MKSDTSSRPIIGLIGVGAMFVWGTSLLYWLTLTESTSWPTAALGWAGATVTSASMLALLVYASNLERRRADLQRRLDDMVGSR